MRICKHCGFKMDDSHKFCPECGAAVTDDLVAPSSSQQEENNELGTDGKFDNEADKPKDDVTNYEDNSQYNEGAEATISAPVKKSNKSKKTIGLIVAIACILGIVLFFVSKPRITSITATYNGSTEEGTILDENNPGFEVKAVYSNGDEEAVEGWTIKNPYKLGASSVSTVTIEYGKYSTDVTVECTSPSLESVTTSYSGSHRPGTVVTKEYFTITGNYSDGSSKEIEEWSLDSEPVLEVGKDVTVNILYGNGTYPHTINVYSKKCPAVKGDVIDCTSEEFIDYYDYSTNDRVRFKKTISGQRADGIEDNVYELYCDDEHVLDLLIEMNNNKIAFILMSMVEGQSSDDAHAWAFITAWRIDEIFEETNSDLVNELVTKNEISKNGLSILNTSSITSGRYSYIICPTGNKSVAEDIVESEDTPDEDAPDGLSTSEADWNNWKSSHSISLYSFMRSSSSVDFNWTIPENGDSKDKICYVVDENNNRLNSIYMMYGVKSQKITYVALYTDDSSVLESDEYKTNLRKLIQAYTADYKDGEVSVVISDDRADEIINYIIDNRVEHCLVDEMKIRGLFSEDDEVYGITIGY